jgi:hypothetical protein
MARPMKSPEPMMVPVLNVTMNPVAPAMKPAAAPAMATMKAPSPVMAAAPVMAPVSPAMAPAPKDTGMAPATATAPQPAAASPKESGWDKATKWIDRLDGIVYGVFLLLMAILGLVLKAGWAKNKRLQSLVKMALDNYSMVEKLAVSTGWKGDDKMAQLFKRMLLELQAQGEKPLSAEEKALVKRKVADLAAVDKTEAGGKVKTKDAEA